MYFLFVRFCFFLLFLTFHVSGVLTGKNGQGAEGHGGTTHGSWPAPKTSLAVPPPEL